LLLLHPASSNAATAIPAETLMRMLFPVINAVLKRSGPSSPGEILYQTAAEKKKPSDISD
jgi:hypothetical protein